MSGTTGSTKCPQGMVRMSSMNQVRGVRANEITNLRSRIGFSSSIFKTGGGGGRQLKAT